LTAFANKNIRTLEDTEMVQLSSLAIAVGVGLSLTVGVGEASASPDLGPLLNTTCSYDQVVGALNAQNPVLARQLASSPLAQSEVQRFLASPADQRQAMIVQVQSSKWGQQYTGVLLQVAGSCNNY
jgi:hemophore-related protein